MQINFHDTPDDLPPDIKKKLEALYLQSLGSPLEKFLEVFKKAQDSVKSEKDLLTENIKAEWRW